MAGPLSGIAGQQQVPLSQPLQQNQNTNAVRQQDERQPEANRVQPQGAPSAETQNAETNNQDVIRQQLEQSLAGNQSDPLSNETPRRGSLIDVVI